MKLLIALGLAAAIAILLPIATAEATTTIRLQRLTFDYDAPFPICGVTADHIHVLLRNYIYKGYDDGSYDIKAVHSVQFWQGTTLIADSAQTQFLSDSGTNQFNVIIHCENGASDTNSHVGYQIVNGIITNLHYT